MVLEEKTIGSGVSVMMVLVVLVLVLGMGLAGCIGLSGDNGVRDNETGREHGMSADNSEEIPREENGGISVNKHPIASIWASKTEALIGEVIMFDASNSTDRDGEIVAYTWDFDSSDGIGIDASGIRVNHTFNIPKKYIVTLVVEDDKGATDTAMVEINIVNKTGEGLRAINVECDEGNEGTITTTLNPADEEDKKHHWDMMSNAVKVRAVLEWSDTSWDLEFSIGVGECPDKGEIKAITSSSTGTIVLEYSVTDGYLAEGQWFAHIKVNNPEDHTPRIDTCAYTITIVVYIVE